MATAHLTDYIEQFTPTITDVADQLWSFAEISLQEVRSAALLQAVLQAHQFTITHATVGTRHRLCRRIWHWYADHRGSCGIRRTAGLEQRCRA